VGSKAVIYGRDLLIEKDDAVAIEVGEKVTLIKWGNITISKKEVDFVTDNITLTATIDVADTNFKGTKKITWVCNDPDTTVEITLVEFDHLITKKKIEDNDDVQNLVNTNSCIEYTAIGEGSMRALQRGTTVQLERRGFFFIDHAATLEGKSLRLNFVPDGKTKSMSAITHKLDQKEIAAGKGKAEGANRAEAKKIAAAAAAGGPVEDGAAAVEGGEVKKSKKDIKKEAKKEQKKAKKAAAKEGGAAAGGDAPA
jgi:glutamyl-tRNA synthetase